MAARLSSWRSRSLAQAGLAGPDDVVFKHDARSRVWQTSTSAGVRVIKRFEHQPWRQRLALLLGGCAAGHPGRLELRWNRRLRARGVRVVPIIDAGWEPAGLGCRVWLATPHMGESMQQRLRGNPSHEQGKALVDAAAALARDLLAANLTFKDLKPSNIIIDEQGRGWLIDVGSVRPATSPRARARMLAVMDRVLARDGASTAWRERFLDQVRQAS